MTLAGCTAADELRDRAEEAALQAAGQAVGREVGDLTDRAVTGTFELVGNAVQCALGDETCVREAREDSRPVVVTDGQGLVVEEIPGEGAADTARTDTSDENAVLTGVYGHPEDETPRGRRFFVTETCAGGLVVGAMWGDVAPWTLKPVSDDAYEAPPNSPLGETMRLTLEPAAGEEPASLTFLTPPFAEEGRLERLEGLPDHWEDCLDRGRR